MNVFNNVSTQMSGLGTSLGSWFKKDGEPGTDPQVDPAASSTVPVDDAPTQEVTVVKEVSKKKKERDSDDTSSQHSGATESADSSPPTPTEEATDAKFGAAQISEVTKILEGIGTFNLSGVSSRASASAKSVGSFFSTAFSKAGASVKEASSIIKDTVVRNGIISEFNKEQDAFIAAKGLKSGQAVPPWVGYPQEESLKEEITALSMDRRNFVRAPPTGVSFEFDLEQFLPMAEATLAVDQNLEKMRFDLVPKIVTEEDFWRNYFYRVGLIRQSTELQNLEKDESSANRDDETKDVSRSKKRSAKDKDLEEELRAELLGTSTGDELCDDYEVVGGVDEKDVEKWEEELQDMIDGDDTADLR